MTQDFSGNHEDFPLDKWGISVINESKEISFNGGRVQTEEVENTGAKVGLFEKYTKEASQFSLLTPEEETALAQTVKNGDVEASEKARQKLITSNLRLVIKIARDFSKHWTQNLTDLIQEGNIGLLYAVKKFDPEMGIKFSYYSSFWIRARILKFIMENWRLVKIGTTQAQRKLFYNLKREKKRLLAGGFEVSPQLLAEVMEVTEKEVMEMEQRMQGWDLSLEAPVKYDSDESHKDFLPDNALSPEKLAIQADLLTWLRQNLEEFRKTISKRESSILDQRILSELPLTLEEIGSHYKISRERVRQIEERLFEKLKKFIKEIDSMQKGEGLTRIMGATSAQVIRELGIETISQLTSLTSDEFVQKFAGRKNHAPTIRAIAEGMNKNKKFFTDGEEATRNLIAYHPSTYKPPAETPASATANPLAERLAVSGVSPDAPDRENSLRTTLKRFSAAFDLIIVNGGSPEKIEGYEENFVAENEQEYLLSISITRKNPPA